MPIPLLDSQVTPHPRVYKPLLPSMPASPARRHTPAWTHSRTPFQVPSREGSRPPSRASSQPQSRTQSRTATPTHGYSHSTDESRHRSRESESVGCGGCFGGGGSRARSERGHRGRRVQGDSEDEEEEREVEGVIYYDVTDRGRVVMDARGKEVMEYMRGVVSNMYRNCFF